MSFIEVLPDEYLLDPLKVEALNLAGKDVSFYINGTEHKIQFADAATALAVYENWRDFVGIFDPTKLLKNGDLVEVDRAADKGSVTDRLSVFRQPPAAQAPYWVLEDPDGEYEIYAAEELTMIKRNP